MGGGGGSDSWSGRAEYHRRPAARADYKEVAVRFLVGEAETERERERSRERGEREREAGLVWNLRNHPNISCKPAFKNLVKK